MTIRMIEGEKVIEILVSIIVPVYNTEQYLEQCLVSIQRQTHRCIEVFLIDDGSQDQSGKICDTWSKIDRRFQSIHIDNQDVSMARNIGIEEATGDYVAFIDSDDYVDECYIQRLLQTILYQKTKVALCNFDIIKKEKKINNNKFPVQKTIDSNTFLEKAYVQPFSYGVLWNKLYSAEIFNKIRFTQKRAGDAFILLDIMKQCDKIACTNQVLYHYRDRKNSLSRMGYEEYLGYELKWIQHHINYLLQFEPDRKLFLLQKLYCNKIMYYYLKLSKKGKKYYKKLYRIHSSDVYQNCRFDKLTRIKYYLFNFIK